MLISSKANNVLNSKKTIVVDGNLINFSTPKVMGILNVSPDSFFDGGEYTEEESITRRVNNMLAEGADIIDIGGMSTRPGADQVSEDEELRRLLPAISIVKKLHPNIPISVDTYRSKVAKTIVEQLGDVIINDISGGTFDEQMYATVAQLNVPYILMHIHGSESNMHDTPAYADIIKDISMFFSQKVQQLSLLGVKDIILDPGFGFGKTLDNNYDLLNRIDAFKIFELPMLVGISRKSMFYKLLDCTAKESLPATIAANTMALLSGANILRVHDVKEAADCVCIYNKLKEVAE